MVDEHLVGVGDSALVIGVREVRSQLREACPQRDEVRGSEGSKDGPGGLERSAGVVVEQHERDVVEVLREIPRPGRFGLGQQEPGQPCDLNLHNELRPADACPHLADVDVSRGVARAAQVDCPEAVTAVELERCVRRDPGVVGEELELDDRAPIGPVVRHRQIRSESTSNSAL